MLEPVGDHDEEARQRDHEGGGRVVGTPICVCSYLLSHDFPVFVNPCLHRKVHGVTLPCALEHLVAIVDELDGSAQLLGEPAGAEILGIHVYLLAKATAHLGLDHTDFALLVPASKVRVIKPKVGGGFGQKIDMYAKDFCACWFAKELGRPVKFVYDRDEVFQSTRQRHPMYLTVKTGVNKDGEIVAQKITAHADGGAYNSTPPLMITLSCFFIMIPYRLENLSYEGYHVYTNKPVGGAMRGHGIPQARFAIERQLDLIAERIGMDPVDIRVRNAIKEGEEHPAGFIINTCGFGDSVVEAAKAIGWKEKRGKLPVGRGVGLAGASDIGQGAETVICQIVAEQLGVPMEDVKITAADTGTCPLDAGTFGSGVTVRAGNAALAAANDVREQLFPVVAEYLGCEVDDVEAANRKFWVKDDPERSVSLKEIIRAYQYSDRAVPIVGRGSWTPPVEQPTSLLTKNGNFSPNYS